MHPVSAEPTPRPRSDQALNEVAWADNRRQGFVVQEEDMDSRRHGVVVRDTCVLEALAMLGAQMNDAPVVQKAEVKIFQKPAGQAQLIKLSKDHRKIIVLDGKRASEKNERLDKMEKELGTLLGF